MRSTGPTKILARTTQSLAVVALMAGAVLGGQSVAGAEPDANGWDKAGFDKCLKDSAGGPKNDQVFHYWLCCQQNGGRPDNTVDDKPGCLYGIPLEAPTDPTGKPGTQPLPKAPDAGVGPGAPIGPVPVGPAGRG